MKLSIIPSDGAVYKDGLCYANLDLSNIPDNIHALQWYETEGEIEFSGTPKPQNEIITELPSWVNACVAKWDEAKAAHKNAIAQIAANQPQTTGTQAA
jgi:hypothetical protein